jgi:hypothetical protein
MRFVRRIRGTYVPGLIDEPVPGVAAVVENTLREVIV